MITDVYFSRSRSALNRANMNPRVLFNVFVRSKEPFMVCGLDDVEEMLGKRATVQKHYQDGMYVPAGANTLMTYEGSLLELIEFETAICATISAQTTAATTMSRIVAAANGKPVFYFGTRHRSLGCDIDWCKGTLVGGAAGIASEPTAEGLGHKSIGTMPHAFILACGSTLEASKIYKDAHPSQDLVVLIDTYGKELSDTRALWEFWGYDLEGVRIDTHGGRYCEGCIETEDDEVFVKSDDPIIKDMVKDLGGVKIAHSGYIFGKGVTVEAIIRLRNYLPEGVKIVASSGFTSGKIQLFEECEAGVDAYGCGLSNPDVLMTTSDIVMLDGKPVHKTGRYEDSYIMTDTRRFAPVVESK